jgi:metal-sulfur cluster biosynthetic enzyme
LILSSEDLPRSNPPPWKNGTRALGLTSVGPAGNLRLDAGPASIVVDSRALKDVIMITQAEVKKALRTVQDPEMKLDLVVLGLIYDIQVDGARVDVTMSLTSPACPVAGQIVEDARAAVEALEGVEEANVELTFSPRWTPDRIPATIRAALGL